MPSAKPAVAASDFASFRAPYAPADEVMATSLKHRTGVTYAE